MTQKNLFDHRAYRIDHRGMEFLTSVISPLTNHTPSHRIPPNMNSAHFYMTMTTTTSGTHREALVLG
ncbi:hypothetical protein [Candidatus Villigracilis affinis]|uniref:hypothetical protein n=1 Tax=Candidatus Villigracilis affinis TaxID=3140682 RepID=UPI001B7650D0|nr:hypothetical protein [Anaerolineales bacterium]MBP8048228.1 hypothetical protein [Anaerolineales bacterium]